MYKDNSSIDLIRRLKRPVLLQGPIGGFFNNLMTQFREGGAEPFKINFNAGDKESMSKNQSNVFDFKDEMKNFGFYLKNFIEVNKIDGIVIFGDCRPLHKVAKFIAKETNVLLFVFEEGYIRPNFITLEVDGVNANSLLMDSIYEAVQEYYYSKEMEAREDALMKELQSKHFHSIKDQGISAAKYWWNMGTSKDFPHYEHHKDGDMFKSFSYWFKSFFKKKLYKFQERNFLDLAENKLKKKYFLVALQVYNDSQIKDHSKFRNNKRFIFDTMKSFAKNSNKKDNLVIKQHPLDIPYHDYKNFIDDLTKKFKIEGRVFYVHDLHLPTLLKNSKGLITINSTTGLSALYHGIPVITLGKAMYNIRSLCYQGGINTFWRAKPVVDNWEFKKFRSFLINKTQIVGSFYNDKYYPKIILKQEKQSNIINIKEKLSIIIEDRKNDQELPIPVFKSL